MSEIFLKIVNMSIAAGWLVLAVVLVRFLLKKAPKWVNPLLWGIVGLRLVLPFSIESVLSLIPTAEAISPEIMYMEEPVISTGFPVVNEFVNPVITENLAPNVGDSVNPLQVWIFVAACIWLIGILGMLLYTVISYMRLHWRMRTAVLFCRNIYQSEQVKTPFVLGILRPRIYLPFGLKEDNIAYVTAHEEAHIHRYDNWTKPLGFLLLSVYWFHPLIWLGYILFCRDIELACDERVIKEMNKEERADYSQALLNCSVSGRMFCASPLTFSEVGVKERVKRVLTYKKPAFVLTVAAVFACGAVAVCFLTNPKTISATGEESSAVVSGEGADSSSVAMIGGADGPTEIEILSRQEKVMQDFLIEFYTFNKDGRMDTFGKEMGSDEYTFDKYGLKDAYGQPMDPTYSVYYQNFTPLVSKEYMETMKTNRIPFKYDKMLSEEYTSVTVDDIQLAHYADDTYEYTVKIALHSGDAVVLTEISGQITIDENVRVSNIWVKESKMFFDALKGPSESSELYTLDEYNEVMKKSDEAEEDEEYCRKLGEIQYAHYLKQKEVQGDLSKEYEEKVQMSTEVNRLSGLKNPEENAREAMTIAYALYLAASESGYVVSALDVQKELYGQKAYADESVKAMMEAFPSEDEFWDYRAMIYNKKLPVENYLEDKKKALAKEKGMEITSEEFTELWANEETRLIREAVEKYFSTDGALTANTVPLEKGEVLTAIEESRLEAVISDSETQSTTPGRISYSLRSPDKTYENSGSPVLVGSVTCTVNDAMGRTIGATFLSAPGTDNTDASFSWEAWKRQLAFAAILYGGFDKPDEIYKTFSAMDTPTGKGYSWDAQLSGGYCQIEWRDSGTSQTMLSVLLFENKAYFDAYQEQRQKAVSPFAVEITSAQIVTNSAGEKELALSVAIENDTDTEWQEVWFECQFNREAGAFIADHFVNGYESEKAAVIAAKTDETSAVHGLEQEWHIPITTEEDLAHNYDDLTMDDLGSAFKEITVTVHAFGKKQITVLPISLSDLPSHE